MEGRNSQSVMAGFQEGHFLKYLPHCLSPSLKICLSFNQLFHLFSSQRNLWFLRASLKMQTHTEIILKDFPSSSWKNCLSAVAAGWSRAVSSGRGATRQPGGKRARPALESRTSVFHAVMSCTESPPQRYVQVLTASESDLIWK